MRRVPLLLTGLLLLSACGGPAAAASCTTTAPGAAPVVLAVDQTANAATVAAVGLQLGVPDHAVTVALATAQRESGLRDLPSGDRDSLGLFQQRPSQGWGTPEQVLDPVHASRAFYQRLLRVPGWQRLAVTQAAQAVQLSAFPQAYAASEASSRTLARVLTGEVATGLSCAHLPSRGLRDGPLREAAARELGSGGLQPASARRRQVAAAWLVAHAQEYGVGAVSVDGRRWSARSGSWSPDPAAVGVAWS